MVKRDIRTASWVIVDKASGKAVWETFNSRTAERINRTSYDVLPIGEYLASLNRHATH